MNSQSEILKVKTIADKLITSTMMIHKYTPSVDYNYWKERFDTKLNETANQIQVSKFFKPTNKKALFKTLGTGVISSTLSNVKIPINKSNLFLIDFYLGCYDMGEQTSELLCGQYL